jgi:polyisoprenoid-binding protein YceI
MGIATLVLLGPICDTSAVQIKILSLIAVLLPALVACQAVPRPDAAVGMTRPAETRTPELPQGRRYLVLNRQSEVRFVLFPAGPLARFGHPHVIGGTAIDGEIRLADAFHDSGLELVIDVSQLEVDRPGWRLDEGFDPDMSESAIADTRRNMLSADQLDAENHPYIEIRSIGLSGPRWQPDIEAQVTLAGQTRELTVPVKLSMDNYNLTAIGRFYIRQSEFGITPFSAAGGSLQVADEVLIRFRIMAMAIED